MLWRLPSFRYAAPGRLVSTLLSCLAGLLMALHCGGKEDNKPHSVPNAEYSYEAPGQWIDLRDEHSPQLTYFRDRPQNNLLAYVKLKGSGQQHYIEKIGIMDMNKRDVVPFVTSEKTAEGYYQGWFTIESFRYARDQKWKLYVKCNLHDLWVKEITD